MRLPVVIAVVVAPAVAHAEVELWAEAGARYEPRDEIQLSFDQHLRFDEDVSRVSAVMPEVRAHYRPVKWFRTGVGYRLQYERNNDGEMVLRHRFAVDARVRYDLGDFRFDYEPQFQEELRPSSNDETRHTIRNELRAAYRGWKPWVPEVAGEVFHVLYEGDTIHLEKLWLTAGVAYERKRQAIEAFYRLELPFEEPMEPASHIVGVGFHYEL